MLSTGTFEVPYCIDQLRVGGVSRAHFNRFLAEITGATLWGTNKGFGDCHTNSLVRISRYYLDLQEFCLSSGSLRVSRYDDDSISFSGESHFHDSFFGFFEDGFCGIEFSG